MASLGRVLIIVQNLPVPFDRRVWLEAMTLRDAGYRVTVISPSGKHAKYPPGHDFLEGIHIYRYPAPPEAHGVLGYVFEFAYCWLMTALLSLWIAMMHGFDIIHACNPPETFFLLAFPYKWFGKKFLFDHHDLSPEMYLAKGGNADGRLYQILLLLEKLTFYTSDVVVTTNESHKKIAVKRGGIEPEKVFIVRSGPDFDRLRILPAEESLKKGRPYLACYLGEMCAQDGVDHLLHAASFLVNELGRKDITFVLMGGGPDLERLQELNHRLSLEDFVSFTGRVSDHDLCRYLSTADICIDPDPYSDWSNQSTMNKIMEYMTFGKPIVAFNLRENRFSGQRAAVYATPNKTDELAAMISALADNDGARTRMGNFGQQRVHEALAWEYSKEPLLAAYVCALHTAEGATTGHGLTYADE